MSTRSVILFTSAFIAYCLLFGKYFTKLHMSYNAWLVVTLVLTAVFLVNFILEKIFPKKSEE